MNALNFKPAIRRLAFAATALSALVLSAVGPAGAQSPAFEAPRDGVYRDRIDWGMLMDLSGPTSGSQSVYVIGFQDRLRFHSEAGGVHGRRINLLAEDGRFNAATDRINFEKLVNQTPVIAISGMGTSAAQVALNATIRAGRVPIVGTYTSTQALSDPVSPMVYNGFCDYKQMAESGVAIMAERLGVRAPKVATVAIESAGGKEYHDFVAAAVARRGGTAHHITMKVTAVDVTPQVLELMALKPDFITIYGVPNTAILPMRALQQYGAKIPAFGITYLASHQIYQGMGPEAGANYSVVSCFTPGGADASPANVEMTSFAERAGRSKQVREDINYVAGWVAGQLAVEALKATGPEPTRAKLVETLSRGFTIDPKGLAAPINWTPTNNLGPSAFRMIGYDFANQRFTMQGEFVDYGKRTN